VGNVVQRAGYEQWLGLAVNLANKTQT